MRERLYRPLELADGEGPRIDDDGAVAPRRQCPRAEVHLAMGKWGTITNDDDSLAADELGLAHQHVQSRHHDRRARLQSAYAPAHLAQLLLRRAVYLAHNLCIRHSEVGLAGVIAPFVAGTMRVHYNEVHVGSHEG